MDRSSSRGLIAVRPYVEAASPPVRLWLDEARRRIADAARRGAKEAVVPMGGSADELDAVRRALGTGGFFVTAVAGEDGAYAVVHW